jgi:thymidylate kinase
MIIEFAGPSCSGKSTLTHSLVAALSDRSMAARRVRARGTETHELLRAVCDPRFVAWLLLNPHLMRQTETRLLAGAIADTRRIKRNEGIVLLDEGPVKRHKNGPLRRARADRLLWSLMPAPDVLVIVTCDPEVRLARLRQEDRPHVREFSDEEILSELTGDQFARRFAAARQVPVVEIDTSVGRDLVPEACALLERFLGGPAVAGTTDSRKRRG